MNEHADSLHLIIAGQSLIEHDLRGICTPGFISLVEQIQSADVAFTNFEGSTHSFDDAGMLTLKWMGFNLLSLANNHAAEGGRESIVQTKEAAKRLGFTTAGTGTTLEEATTAGYMDVRGQRLALIAMDTANLQSKDAIAGQDGKPGVNPLRCVRSTHGILIDEHDLKRNLSAIKQASDLADIVIVSVHEHFWPVEWKQIAFEKEWPTVWKDVLPWKQRFARLAIDAGASMILFHGLPSASAVDVYHGKPILYDIGNFIFHLPHSLWWPNPEVWEGYMVDLILADAKVQQLRLLPIVLTDKLGNESASIEERICPMFAKDQRAEAIIERIIQESSPFGTRMQIMNNRSVAVSMRELAEAQ